MAKPKSRLPGYEIFQIVCALAAAQPCFQDTSVDNYEGTRPAQTRAPRAQWVGRGPRFYDLLLCSELLAWCLLAAASEPLSSRSQLRIFVRVERAPFQASWRLGSGTSLRVLEFRQFRRLFAHRRPQPWKAVRALPFEATSIELETPRAQSPRFLMPAPCPAQCTGRRALLWGSEKASAGQDDSAKGIMFTEHKLRNNWAGHGRW